MDTHVVIYSIILTAVLEFLQRFYFVKLSFFIQGITLALKETSYYFSLSLLFIFITKTLIKRKLGFSTEPLLLLVIGLLPISIFSLYLNQTTGNPLSFLNQEGWGRHITFPWNPLFTYSFYLIQNGFIIGKTHQAFIEFLFAVFLLIAFLYSWKKIRPSYLLYFGLSILFIFSSGTFLSVPRLSMVIFPIYLLLANIKNEQFFNYYMIVSLMFLGLFSTLFLGFYWIY